MTRDELQQQAIRLLGESHRLLKQAKECPPAERQLVAREALRAARNAKRAVERFHAWRPDR